MNRYKISVTNEKELQDAMRLHSTHHKGVWVASVMPFGGDTLLIGFSSPSKIPDEYLSNTSGLERGYAQSGKLYPFPDSALVREQNRGYSDRVDSDHGFRQQFSSPDLGLFS